MKHMLINTLLGCLRDLVCASSLFKELRNVGFNPIESIQNEIYANHLYIL